MHAMMPHTASATYGHRIGNDYNVCIITGDVLCNIELLKQ